MYFPAAQSAPPAHASPTVAIQPITMLVFCASQAEVAKEKEAAAKHKHHQGSDSDSDDEGGGDAGGSRKSSRAGSLAGSKSKSRSADSQPGQPDTARSNASGWLAVTLQAHDRRTGVHRITVVVVLARSYLTTPRDLLLGDLLLLLLLVQVPVADIL